jgi:hypothetical protein
MKNSVARGMAIGLTPASLENLSAPGLPPSRGELPLTGEAFQAASRGQGWEAGLIRESPERDPSRLRKAAGGALRAALDETTA